MTDMLRTVAAPQIGRPGPLEGVTLRGARATAFALRIQVLEFQPCLAGAVGSKIGR
jgi:hypothetical protein